MSSDQLATGQAKATEVFQLDPNTAARDELMKIPGIGEVTANRIIQARPFHSLQDLLKVNGIGPKTLEKFTPYFKFAPISAPPAKPPTRQQKAGAASGSVQPIRI